MNPDDKDDFLRLAVGYDPTRAGFAALIFSEAFATRFPDAEINPTKGFLRVHPGDDPVDLLVAFHAFSWSIP